MAARRAPWSVSLAVLLGTACAVQASVLVATLLSPSLPPTALTAGAPTGAVVSGALDLAAIGALFGRAATVARPAPTDAPVRYRLLGTLATTDAALARALVDAAGHVTVGAVGDKLGDGGVLKTIEPYAVIVERDGVAYEVLFDDKRGRGGLAKAVGTAGDAIVQRTVAADALRRGAADLQLAEVRGTGGELTGYRLVAASSALGLQAGDVIRRVNGVPVGSFAGTEGLGEALLAERSPRLGVERDGVESELAFEPVEPSGSTPRRRGPVDLSTLANAPPRPRLGDYGNRSDWHRAIEAYNRELARLTHGG